MINGLALSGGGSKGAWGGGVLQYLSEINDYDYSIIGGVSTGSLLMPLTSLKKFDVLKEAYTSVSNSDIFKVSPFKVKNKDGNISIKTNYLNIIYNTLIRRQKTFGDSTKLRENLIPKFFTHQDWLTVKEKNIDLFACTTNLTTGELEYKGSLDQHMTYEDFMDWMFASTCAAPFLSILNKNNCEYGDGGYRLHIPIQEVINRGATNVDAINLSPIDAPLNLYNTVNVLSPISRVVDTMQSELSNNDFSIGKLLAKDSDINLKVYYTPRILTTQSLAFDNAQMTGWWNEAYEYTKNSCYKHIVLRTDGTSRVIKDFQDK